MSHPHGLQVEPLRGEELVSLPEIPVEDMFIALGHARPADAPLATGSGGPVRTWRHRVQGWWGARPDHHG